MTIMNIINELEARGIRPTKAYTYIGPSGYMDRMEPDEVLAIESSGGSGQTVQEYAMNPGQYYHRTGCTLDRALRIAGDRPGITEPVEPPKSSRRTADHVDRLNLHAWHWLHYRGGRWYAACGQRYGVGRGKVSRQFARYLSDRMVCAECRDRYLVNHTPFSK